MTQWLNIVLVVVHVLLDSEHSLAAESCSSVGDVRLLESPYSGTVQYCYSASADTGEWIGVCSMGDSATLSEIVCRQVLNNTNADADIYTEYTATEQQTPSILLQCSGTQLSTCQSSLITSTPCPGINTGCRGACTSGRCVCTEGWSGLKCKIPSCNQVCANGGTCSRPGECICNSGWGGESCTEFACEPECENGGNCTGPEHCTCDSARWEGTSCQQAVCNPTCANGGTCALPGQCNCTTGWEGDTCIRAICDMIECENGGTCSAPNECNCTAEWSGDMCAQAVCTPHCENVGNCITPDECNCTAGWSGDTCTNAICDMMECENGGTCSAPNECNCTAEWSGDTCEQAVCNPTCANGGTCTSPGTCTCVEGWNGTACTTPICSSPCENGNCTQPGQCTCDAGWSGGICTEAVCEDGFCQNGGECLYPDTNCTCTPDWQGNQCEIAICYEGFCLNDGNCTFPNSICSCTDEWEGNRCDRAICEDGFCQNGGECLYPDINCTCTPGWQGDQCEIAICEDGFCLNDGNCSSPNTDCDCIDEWEGNRCHIAVCDEPGFCRNGGICLYPNVNCSCQLIWGGDTCETFNYPLVAGSGAALLVTLLIILVAILVIKTVIRKTKKTTVKAKRTFRRSLFQEEIMDISRPIVNPFLKGNALRILNPLLNVENPVTADEDSNSNTIWSLALPVIASESTHTNSSEADNPVIAAIVLPPPNTPQEDLTCSGSSQDGKVSSVADVSATPTTTSTTTEVSGAVGPAPTQQAEVVPAEPKVSSLTAREAPTLKLNDLPTSKQQGTKLESKFERSSLNGVDKIDTTPCDDNMHQMQAVLRKCQNLLMRGGSANESKRKQAGKSQDEPCLSEWQDFTPSLKVSNSTTTELTMESVGNEQGIQTAQEGSKSMKMTNTSANFTKAGEAVYTSPESKQVDPKGTPAIINATPSAQTSVLTREIQPKVLERGKGKASVHGKQGASPKSGKESGIGGPPVKSITKISNKQSVHSKKGGESTKKVVDTSVSLKTKPSLGSKQEETGTEGIYDTLEALKPKSLTLSPLHHSMPHSQSMHSTTGLTPPTITTSQVKEQSILVNSGSDTIPLECSLAKNEEGTEYKDNPPCKDTEPIYAKPIKKKKLRKSSLESSIGEGSTSSHMYNTLEPPPLPGQSKAMKPRTSPGESAKLKLRAAKSCDELSPLCSDVSQRKQDRQSLQSLNQTIAFIPPTFTIPATSPVKEQGNAVNSAPDTDSPEFSLAENEGRTKYDGSPPCNDMEPIYAKPIKKNKSQKSSLEARIEEGSTSSHMYNTLEPPPLPGQSKAKKPHKNTKFMVGKDYGYTATPVYAEPLVKTERLRGSSQGQSNSSTAMNSDPTHPPSMEHVYDTLEPPRATGKVTPNNGSSKEAKKKQAVANISLDKDIAEWSHILEQAIK